METLSTYHVLLLYPDYMADQYGDTYLASIEAENEEQAVDIAKNNCLEANKVEGDTDPAFDKEDFVCLIVVKGGEVI